ncbi:MAG TPA: type 1 glutamine amidotransferase domain-containing protein [Methanomassiliicoccales archaeon]|nr:type 1 glutamine amidotransferase domain-containing protein [Methanomassiliicoccales archaeon]
MPPGEATRAIMLTADKFEDLEVLYPYFRLLEEGIHADVAAPKMEQLNGEHGYSLMPAKTFDQVDPGDYDVLFLPGGDPNGAPMTVRKHPKAQAIAREFMQKNKPVASICHGPYTLISAGVVRGRKMTSFWGDGVPQELTNAGAQYADAEVVVDGNLVTSRFPGDLPSFMRESMKLIRTLR